MDKERRKQRRDQILFDKVILRIKELRRINGHSQEDLAAYTEVDIANLESGNNFPNLTTLSIICKFYNITLDEFFAPLQYPPRNKN